MPSHATDIPRAYPCPAKINLALSVGGPLADGLHPICSWMVRVSFCDELILARLDDGEQSQYETDWAPDAPRPIPIDWCVEQDLTHKAHLLLEQYTERQLPLAMELRKRIPVGAGLGGGSSDAATMLTATNDLFDLNLSPDTLRELATHLGSDVPFFLGPPSAIVSGLGELIEPAPLHQPLHLTLILPDLHCNTAQVYRQFDDLKTGKNVDEAAIRALVAADDITDDVPLFNDLAEPACRVQPPLADIRRRCEQIAGQAVHVTGSGAGLFLTAQNQKEAQRLADAVTTGVGVPALPVQTPTST